MLPGDGDLQDRVRRLERQVSDLQRVDRMIAASVGAGGLRVHNGGALRSDDFDGQDLDQPGDNGWWLGPEGLVVNRAVIRTGTLTVVGHDDALEGLSLPPSLTTSYQTLATVTIPVPDWATTVDLVATVFGSSSLIATGESDTLYVLARIEGQDSEPGRQSSMFTMDVSIPDATASASFARTLTDPLPSNVSASMRARKNNADANAVLTSGGVTLQALFTDL